MNVDNPWTLEKWHVRTNFRRAGYWVPDEAIELPPLEICGPDLSMENREFYVTVTVNQGDSTKVRCRISHDTIDVSKKISLESQLFEDESLPVHPQFKEVLDSMPMPMDLRGKTERDFVFL